MRQPSHPVHSSLDLPFLPQGQAAHGDTPMTLLSAPIRTVAQAPLRLGPGEAALATMVLAGATPGLANAFA